MQADGPKIDYVEWQRFRDDLHELRKRYSWSELSDLFGQTQNGGAGWAERADQHRSLVAETDVKRARELVEQPPPAEPSATSKKVPMPKRRELTDVEHAEIRKRLNALREYYGSWGATANAMGKNQGTGYHYGKVAEGAANGSPRLLTLLRKVEAEGPLRPSTNGRGRGNSLDSAGQAEVQERLRALYAKHKSWSTVAELVGRGSAKGYYANLGRRGGGGSPTLLKRLRSLDGVSAETPAANVEALQKADDTVPAPRATPRPPPVDLSRAPASDAPWPARAQEHLRAALGIVETEVRTLPKTLQSAAGDLTAQIRLAIEELDAE